VAAADAGAAAHDANGWRSGGAANRMRAWPCPMLMTRRKIIAQTTIGNETRPIKTKLRNASCLWDTHRRSLWVLDFIRRSPPRPWNIVQHDCGNVNDQRRNHRPPQKCGLPSKLSRALAVAVDPISNNTSSILLRMKDSKALPDCIFVNPIDPPASSHGPSCALAATRSMYSLTRRSEVRFLLTSRLTGFDPNRSWAN
jgi:hypothetical protein